MQRSAPSVDDLLVLEGDVQLAQPRLQREQANAMNLLNGSWFLNRVAEGFEVAGGQAGKNYMSNLDLYVR
ncbi:MAG: hypothetical protein NC238_07700 [Dehalobacter sp.]|nr:hypothetical protein [Dehalobacter sp.]